MHGQSRVPQTHSHLSCFQPLILFHLNRLSPLPNAYNLVVVAGKCIWRLLERDTSVCLLTLSRQVSQVRECIAKQFVLLDGKSNQSLTGNVNNQHCLPTLSSTIREVYSVCSDTKIFNVSFIMVLCYIMRVYITNVHYTQYPTSHVVPAILHKHV